AGAAHDLEVKCEIPEGMTRDLLQGKLAPRLSGNGQIALLPRKRDRASHVLAHRATPIRSRESRRTAGKRSRIDSVAQLTLSLVPAPDRVDLVREPGRGSGQGGCLVLRSRCRTGDGNACDQSGDE